METTAKDFVVLVSGTGYIEGEGRHLSPPQRAIVIAPHGQPHPVVDMADTETTEIVRLLNNHSWGYSPDTLFAVVPVSPLAFHPDEYQREPRSLYFSRVLGRELQLLAALTDQGSDWRKGDAAVSKCGRIAEFEESYNVVTRAVQAPSDEPVRKPDQVVGVHRVVRFSGQAVNVVKAVRASADRYDFHEYDPVVDHTHDETHASLFADECHALVNQAEMNAQQFLVAVNADTDLIDRVYIVCAFSADSLEKLGDADRYMMTEFVKSLGKTHWTDDERKKAELLYSGRYATQRIPTKDVDGDVLAHRDLLYSGSTLFREAIGRASAHSSGVLDMGPDWPIPAPTKLAAQTCIMIIYIGLLDTPTLAEWIQKAGDEDVRDLLKMCVALDKAEPDDESRRFANVARTAAKVYFWGDSARVNPQKLYRLWQWLGENLGATVDDLDILHVLIEIYLGTVHKQKLESDRDYRELVEWTGERASRKRPRVDIELVLGMLYSNR